MVSMSELERALDGRGLRMRAFRSGGTWKVLLSGEDTAENFAGTDVSLGAAVTAAIEHCDGKRHHRALRERP